jgi:hypothetical protein
MWACGRAHRRLADVVDIFDLGTGYESALEAVLVLIEPGSKVPYRVWRLAGHDARRPFGTCRVVAGDERSRSYRWARVCQRRGRHCKGEGTENDRSPHVELVL